jgi:hypothetical protein
MNSERANFGKEKHQNALHPRSTHAPFLGQSWTMSDNEIENWSEEKHCKYSVFGGFLWSVMVC